MTDEDFFSFNALIRRVAAVFRVRVDTDDFKATATSYFQAFKKFSLTDLERGAEIWIERQTKFPKPVEWRMAIPRRSVEIAPMSDAEAREYHRAETRHWTDDPCACRECVTAGVQDKPLRFVPNLDDNDIPIQQRDPIGNRLVIIGHWAHGWELKRTCDAESLWWNQWYEKFGGPSKQKVSKAKLSFRERMAAIFPEKQKRSASDLEPLKEQS